MNDPFHSPARSAAAMLTLSGRPTLLFRAAATTTSTPCNATHRAVLRTPNRLFGGPRGS